MVFSMVVLKLGEWLLYQLLAHSCYRAARKIRNYGFFENPFSLIRPSSSSSSSPPQQFNNTTIPSFPSLTKYCSSLDHHHLKSQTLVLCDMFGTLLRSQSPFPFFMLVAFEGGSIFRALLLLISSPFIWALEYFCYYHNLGLRLMIFITFCGLKVKDMDSVGRAVLPKFFLENINLEAYEVFLDSRTGRRIVFTSVPRVLVQWFLDEYLNVDDVVGTELQSFNGYFTGFTTGSGLLVKHKALKELFGDDDDHNNKPDIIGLGTSSSDLRHDDHLFLSLCKEAYVVSKEDIKNSSAILPREKYPKPLVFHDGRLAFLPTPLATLCMFLWLPLGITLSIFRLLIGIFLPYKMAILLATFSGVNIRIKGNPYPTKSSSSSSSGKGVLYVCNHRTLLDPVFLSTSLGKSLTAVTYSLSKMSEFIAPIRTVRLTRDRKQDREKMQKLLSEGDLVVCPEGTTCREPYLLRFSSLFAELADEIVPVAMNTHVSMFYGTTASGLKCLDSIFFLMNPRPSYYVQFLEKVPREMTCAGGRSSCEVANYIQKQLGDALGFECTTLTRRDKYMMLAGNEGVVNDKKKK